MQHLLTFDYFVLFLKQNSHLFPPCMFIDEDLAEVIDDRFKMHFIDRPPLVPVKTLPEELCFGVPAIACAYIACLKVISSKMSFVHSNDHVPSSQILSYTILVPGSI